MCLCVCSSSSCGISQRNTLTVGRSLSPQHIIHDDSFSSFFCFKTRRKRRRRRDIIRGGRGEGLFSLGVTYGGTHFLKLNLLFKKEEKRVALTVHLLFVSSLCSWTDGRTDGQTAPAVVEKSSSNFESLNRFFRMNKIVP